MNDNELDFSPAAQYRRIAAYHRAEIAKMAGRELHPHQIRAYYEHHDEATKSEHFAQVEERKAA